MVSGMIYEPYEQGGNNAPWAPLSWWIRALYKSTYYIIIIRFRAVARGGGAAGGGGEKSIKDTTKVGPEKKIAVCKIYRVCKHWRFAEFFISTLYWFQVAVFLVFESHAGSRVNTPLVAVTNVGWCVYTPVFLGVRGNTLRCPRTKGTAVREWVNGMEWVNGFLPNPFIHDLFCWSSRHKFVKTVL